MKTPDINRILRDNPRSSRYGAPLGARNLTDAGVEDLLLQRVRLIDGDYGPDGTYWGGGPGTPRLWCAFNSMDVNYSAGHGTRIYVRGRDREQAAAEVRRLYPQATFRRPA